MRRTRTVVMAILSALTATTCLAQPQANAAARLASPPPMLAKTAFVLDLRVDYEKPALSGSATLTLANRGTRAEREIPLLLNRLMTVNAVRDGKGHTLSCRSTVAVFDDEPLRQVRYVRARLASPLRPGGTVTLRIEYGGPLVGYVETGSRYVKDRINPAFTIIREDALAFPVVGVPSDRINRTMPRDDFRFNARVTVPSGQTVATGGRQTGRTEAGSRVTFEFAGDAVPFLNIAIAPYRLLATGGIDVYALPDDVERAPALADATGQALARLESWYGSLPARPHVTIIEIPEGFGSQASLTAGIILEAPTFRERANLRALYHEMTHLWNPRDLDRPSPRWNEGLAMYLQYRLAHDLDGFAGTADAWERSRTRVCEAGTQATLRRTPFAGYGRADLTDYSYPVGMLMFAALDAAVGRDTLDSRLRSYVQQRFAGGGTTADLMNTLTGSDADSGRVRRLLDDWMTTSNWIGTVCGAPSFATALDHWRAGAAGR